MSSILVEFGGGFFLVGGKEGREGGLVSFSTFWKAGFSRSLLSTIRPPITYHILYIYLPSSVMSSLFKLSQVFILFYSYMLLLINVMILRCI